MEFAISTTTAKGPSSVFPYGEATAEDEFMVVPSSVEGQQLDEFLLEANFAGLTGTILSPPGIYQVNNFCTIDEDGGRQSDGVNLVDQDFLFEQYPHQETFLQQEQLLNGEVDFAFTTPVQTIISVNGQYFDDDFDFGPGTPGRVGVGDENDASGEAFGESVVWREEEPRCELEDHDSMWLTENADLSFIEKLTSEDEQQSQLLDELLRDDHVFREAHSPVDIETIGEEIDIDRSEEIDILGDADATDILEEIYREAQQVDFGPTTQASSWTSEEIVDQGWSRIPTSLVSMVHVAPIIAKTTPTTPAPRFFHTDHDFGSARRGRPPGSSNKRKGKTTRREPGLKTKKKRQNREAALRYRLKKRSEKMEKEGELELLQKRNQYLKNQKHSLKAEVDCLKELLLEIKKVKGL